MNMLDKRRRLGKDIEKLNHSVQGPWFVLGYFNIVCQVQDIVGGNH